MADALCGPSNPLQLFKQQTSLDRTLQQDRLSSSRPSPAQGFRSHDPNAGLLDPEFDAFQAGLPAPDLPQYHQPFHPQQQQQHPAFAASSQAPSWASDFQNMQISPPPAFQQHNHHIPHASPQTANWAQGFRENIAQNAPRAQQTSSPSPLAFQQRARYGGFQSQFAQQPSYAPTMQSKGKDPVIEQFDEAAFEAAFDQARDDMMVDVDDEEGRMMDDVVQITALQDQENLEILRSFAANEHGGFREETVGFNAEDGLLEPETVQSELLKIHEEQQQEQAQNDSKQRQEDDALAATAQELLDKVEHNKSDKFRNSQFLSLMRKLRDREVKVEGDKMVSTETASTTSTINGEPQTLTTAASTMRFDNTEQRPSPLAGLQTTSAGAGVVDSRPPEYGIPTYEQDLDAGRVDPRDGQEVVDLLNRPGMEGVGDDIDSSQQTFACSTCEASFPRPNYLRRHELTHQGPGHHCPLPNCERHVDGAYSSLLNLADHLVTHMKGPRRGQRNKHVSWSELEASVRHGFEGEELRAVMERLQRARWEMLAEVMTVGPDDDQGESGPRRSRRM